MELLTFLSARLVEADPALALAPYLDAKKLEGARAFAACGDEVAIAQLDTTVWGSGKCGVLLTEQALYFDDPRQRIRLANITADPAGGYLDDGRPLRLPDLAPDDAALLCSLLEALLAYNYESRQLPPACVPMPGPLGLLCVTHLRQPFITLAPRIDETTIAAAASGFPVWLDPSTGERLLAFIDESESGGREGIALTDRRLLAWLAEEACVVDFAAIDQVQVLERMFGRQLSITAGNDTWVLPCDAAARLQAFLLGARPIAQQTSRSPPPRARSPEASPFRDHHGVELLPRLAAAIAADPRIAIIAGLVEHAHGRGTAAWHDQVGRVLRLSQTPEEDPGADRFESCLRPDDVRHALGLAAGAEPRPVGARPGTYDLSLGSGWQAASTIGTLGLVAVAALLGADSAPVDADGGGTEIRLRVVVTAVAAGSDVQLTGNKPARERYPALIDALRPLQLRLMLLRVLFGERPDAAALLSRPWSAVQAAIHHRLGPVDLGVLDPW